MGLRSMRIKKGFVFTVLVAVLVGFIAFVEKKEDSKVFHNLEVIVEGISDVYFVEEKEIAKILETEFPLLKPGTAMSEISLETVTGKLNRLLGDY
jgi:cell division protein FtsQ